MKQKHIRSGMFVEQGIGKVVIDRDQIEQVLDNLMSNALKYTPDGGSIRIEARRNSEGMLSISVQDTGIGIPKKIWTGFLNGFIV